VATGIFRLQHFLHHRRSEMRAGAKAQARRTVFQYPQRQTGGTEITAPARRITGILPARDARPVRARLAPQRSAMFVRIIPTIGGDRRTGEITRRVHFS
jgi:hypothetical protein